MNDNVWVEFGDLYYLLDWTLEQIGLETLNPSWEQKEFDTWFTLLNIAKGLANRINVTDLLDITNTLLEEVTQLEIEYNEGET